MTWAVSRGPGVGSHVPSGREAEGLAGGMGYFRTFFSDILRKICLFWAYTEMRSGNMQRRTYFPRLCGHLPVAGVPSPAGRWAGAVGCLPVLSRGWAAPAERPWAHLLRAVQFTGAGFCARMRQSIRPPGAPAFTPCHRSASRRATVSVQLQMLSGVARRERADGEAPPGCRPVATRSLSPGDPQSGEHRGPKNTFEGENWIHTGHY